MPISGITLRKLDHYGEEALHYIGNLREGHAGVPERLPRYLHAPACRVVYRGHLDQAGEAVDQPERERPMPDR